MTEDRMKKIRVSILGATGIVGQRIVVRLENHPWFEIGALCASGESAGLPFEEAVKGRWRVPGDVPAGVRDMIVRECRPDPEARLVFSALDAAIAGPVEEEFARSGSLVFSNAKNHRMAESVPLVIPEVNAEHLRLIERQAFAPGGIVTNPNCSTAGLVLALAPLHRRFAARRVFVTTMQALSGAGYPGVPSLDIAGNVLPNIPGEEEKIEAEPRKILGDGMSPADIRISAQCNRVATTEGHLMTVAVEFGEKPSLEDAAAAISSFAPFRDWRLPTAPEHPLFLHKGADRPQPVLDAGRGAGMTVTIGRLRADPIFDLRFTLLVNNLVRGAAGAAVLNAELALAMGYVH